MAARTVLVALRGYACEVPREAAALRGGFVLRVAIKKEAFCSSFARSDKPVGHSFLCQTVTNACLRTSPHTTITACLPAKRPGTGFLG